MSAPAPPLRFVLVVLVVWVSLRGIAGVSWRDGQGPQIATLSPVRAARVLPKRASLPLAVTKTMMMPIPDAFVTARRPPAERLLLVGPSRPVQTSSAYPARAAEPSSAGLGAPDDPPPAAFAWSAAAFTDELAPAARRWSGSAWLLLRDDVSVPSLAPGGTLGGSQAGARLLYRVNRDGRRTLAVAARVYVPLREREGAEGALGLDWRPLARAPIHILAERRERLGRSGRSAFALTVYGGRSGRLPGRFLVDSYLQAGIVGLRSRDPFVDGAVRIARPVGPVEIGAASWGAAQPGAARLDVGPQAAVRAPIGHGAVRVAAEWRFRIAGDARPASGPALTIAADF